MPLILALETATPVCSVALANDGQILSLRESAIPNAHAEVLTVFIEELFREASLPYHELDAVSVSMGPGSFTGLRIGVSAAKGFCYALDKPLIAVPTLQAMAAGMNYQLGMRNEEFQLPTAHCRLLYCPMIDARRMEVYCAVYDKDLMEIRSTDAVIVDPHSFDDLTEKYTVLFAGNGAGKCEEVLSRQPNVLFLNDFKASARFMIPLAEERFHENRFEDVAYFEPFYLKDFIPGKSRVKGLR